jgi:hypothetical protein
MYPLWRGQSEPKVGRGGDFSWGRGRGRARTRFLPRPRLRPSLGVGRGGDLLPRPRPKVGRGGASCCARGWTCCCQPCPGGWHSSRSGVSGAVFPSDQSGKGRSDCGHFDLADWGARVRIRCQAILALNAPAIRSVGEAIWPRLLLDEACPSWLPKEALGREFVRDYCSRPRPGSGEARLRPLVDEALTWTVPISLCSLCWGCLPAVFRSVGVPLITVPDSIVIVNVFEI